MLRVWTALAAGLCLPAIYLNYSKSVQRKWEQDLRNRIEEATRNWPRLHK